MFKRWDQKAKITAARNGYGTKSVKQSHLYWVFEIPYIYMYIHTQSLCLCTFNIYSYYFG